MSCILELKKIKRTGFFAAFLAGGILAGAFPVINTAVRTEMFTSQPGSPAAILMNANYETMAMLSLLLLAAGTCILYHIEYADNGILKMQTLPVKESGLFFGKFLLLLPAFFLMLCIQCSAMIFCGLHWLDSPLSSAKDLSGCFSFSFLLTLPAALLLLVISSLCRNMWIMLGIGILGIFLGTTLPSDSFAASLFPFAMPFHTLPDMEKDLVIRYVTAAVSESVMIVSIEIIFIRIRRLFA